MKQLQFLFFVLLCGMASPSCAQEQMQSLDSEEKKKVIDSVSSILESNYVFPEVADKMNVFIGKQFKTKAYRDIDDPQEFAQQLTEDLRSISNDLHLRVRFDPENIARRRNASLSAEDSIAFAKRTLQRNKARNYGFKEVRILDGNIGYLNLSGFAYVDEGAGAVAEAAMNFLSNADALIIDLRENGGGSPSMIQLITSYLYGPNRVHLNNFYNRPRNEHTQTWTLPYVPGVRRPDVDVYVLTSGGTFSAAEEFSYNLRNLERATLVGEVTGGGAHPGGTRVATDRFTIWVPDGRAINPITNTNWEGVGVEPHIKTSSAEALAVAQITVLKKMLERREDGDNFVVEWALEGLKSKNSDFTVNEDVLKSYVGNYGPRKITFKQGSLYYQREGNREYKLIPISETKFRMEEISNFRIKVLKENDEVVALQGLYNTGRTDKSMRSEK